MNQIKRVWTGLTIVALLGLATACSTSQTPQNSPNLPLTLSPATTSIGSISVDTQSILQIQGTSGNINVESGNTKAITMTVNGKNVSLSQRYHVISPTSDVTHANINVTVPSNINLNLIELDGSISIKGVKGKINLLTQNGNITVSKSTLSGASNFTSTSGLITFSGSLDATSNDSIVTDQGAVQVTLPTDATFHLNATVKSGTITSIFPVTIQHSNNNTSSEVNQDVGTTQPKLILQVNKGSITLQKD